MAIFRVQLFADDNSTLLYDGMMPFDKVSMQPLGVFFGNKILEGFELKPVITEISEK